MIKYPLSSEERKEFDSAKAGVFAGKLELSADSPVLAFADEKGKSIAHYAAQKGLLPESFDRWDMRDGSGVSVAEVALRSKSLPESFNGWGMPAQEYLADTIAHVGAKEGLLPKNFKDWGIHTQHTEMHDLVDTVAHTAVKKGTLPKTFDQWGLMDGKGDTVAHVAAARGVLPKGFPEWDLKNAKGQSVIEVAAAHPKKGAQYLSEYEAAKISAGIQRGVGAQESKLSGEAKATPPSQVPPGLAEFKLIHDDASIVVNEDNSVEMNVDADGRTFRIKFDYADAEDRSGPHVIEENENLKALAGHVNETRKLGASSSLDAIDILGKQGVYKDVADLAQRECRISDIEKKGGPQWDHLNHWSTSDICAFHANLDEVKDVSAAVEGIDYAGWRNENYEDRIQRGLPADVAAFRQERAINASQAQADRVSSVISRAGAQENKLSGEAKAAQPSKDAPIETSSTGRITGGGRFSRPPDLSNREPEPERRPIKAFIRRGGM